MFEKNENINWIDPEYLIIEKFEVKGYVQTNNCIILSKMQSWIDSATWEPVLGGLMSDDEYRTNMRRYNNPTDSMTQLTVFRIVRANNAGRSAEEQTGKVNENY